DGPHGPSQTGRPPPPPRRKPPVRTVRAPRTEQRVPTAGTTAAPTPQWTAALTRIEPFATPGRSALCAHAAPRPADAAARARDARGRTRPWSTGRLARARDRGPR